MISERAVNLLRRIRDSEDGELVRSVGGGWWVDDHHVAGRDATELLRFALISCRLGFGTDYEVYCLNQDGDDILRDKKHVPRIVTAIRGASSLGW